MKNKILAIFGIILLTSCNSQTKINLEELNFKENIVSELKKYDVGQLQYEENNMWTHMPASQTFDIKKFSFGNVEFTDKDESNLSPTNSSKISFIWKSIDLEINKKNGQIVGYQISLENTDNTNKLFDYLKNKYGKPTKILEKEPEKDKNGNRFGSSAFYWENFKSNKSIIFTKSYMKSVNKFIVNSNVFVINNDAKVLSINPNINLLDKMLNYY